MKEYIMLYRKISVFNFYKKGIKRKRLVFLRSHSFDSSQALGDVGWSSARRMNAASVSGQDHTSWPHWDAQSPASQISGRSTNSDTHLHTGHKDSIPGHGDVFRKSPKLPPVQFTFYIPLKNLQNSSTQTLQVYNHKTLNMSSFT